MRFIVLLCKLSILMELKHNGICKKVLIIKKIVVVKERTKLKRDEKGIVTMDIFDFLLNQNSLYL